MKYHIQKATRKYVGIPYMGPSNKYLPAESENLDDAIALADFLLTKNKVGWNVYDTQTNEIVYSTLNK